MKNVILKKITESLRKIFKVDVHGEKEMNKLLEQYRYLPGTSECIPIEEDDFEEPITHTNQVTLFMVMSLLTVLVALSGCASVATILKGTGDGILAKNNQREDTSPRLVNCTKDAAYGAYYCN